jgi:phospholipase/carboxylesterase
MSKDSYIFREKPGAAPDAPVLFLFHGTGGDENQFFTLAEQLMPGARLVAPRGDVSEGGALRYFRRLAEGQYDMADLAVRTEAMAGFIAAHIGKPRPSRVIALGYSNGANIIANLLIEHPELFDIAVLLHPLIPFVPKPQLGLAGRSILITAGKRDPICPPPATERLEAYFNEQGANTAVFWHEGGHEIRQDELGAIATFLMPYR